MDEDRSSLNKAINIVRKNDKIFIEINKKSLHENFRINKIKNWKEKTQQIESLEKKRRAEKVLDYDLFLREVYWQPPTPSTKVKKKYSKKVMKYSVNKGIYTILSKR